MDSSYKKRVGTHSSGHLYETKLISLLLFRLLHDDDIKECYLASNMDEVGNFDDVCLKMQIAGYNRPILALIQAKHKENQEDVLKYAVIQQLSASFVRIRQLFISNNTFFKGKFEDTDCLFILYTNAKYCTTKEESDRADLTMKQKWKPYKSGFSDKLNKLIATGDVVSQGRQTDFSKDDLEYANEKILEEEIAMLAKHFVKFRDDTTNQAMNIMQDYFILRYHVILAQNVFDVSEIKSENKVGKECKQWRDLTFRQSFFDTEDRIYAMLRYKMYEQIFKTQIKIKREGNSNLHEASIADKLIESFLSEPCAHTLSHLIGTYVIYKNNKLKFITKRPDDDIKTIKKVKMPSLAIEEAEMIAAKRILSSLKLKVPDTFGNIDVKIVGKDKKIDRRLDYLTETIHKLCKQSKFVDPFNVVTIDESLGEGFINLNGGIGSMMGNVMVYDKYTKLYQITANYQSLQNNAKKLLNMLNIKINNLYSYRFEIKGMLTFPKLVFDYRDEAKTMFELAVIYDRQTNQDGVEIILKKEIENLLKKNGQVNTVDKSDSLSIHYHDVIQKWWLFPKTAKYLTKAKNDNLYQSAFNNFIEPQISRIGSKFYENNKIYLGFSFSKSAVTYSIEMNMTIVIVTEIFILTTMKMIDSFENTLLYAVLDLDNILALSIKDFDALNIELRDTEKVLIIICNISKHNRLLHNRLLALAQATENKKNIIITNNESVDIVQEYFGASVVFYDEQQNCIDLSRETRTSIMKNTKVIFQGETVRLDSILNDTSVAYIRGVVLNKIIRQEPITIGKPLTDPSYEKVKSFYVDKEVQITNRTTPICVLKSFNDIPDSAVVILAEAGMGKSTLLTHLSLNTKKIDKKIWIVRINLLDHTKKFKKWQDDKTIIDTLEAIKFMCQVVLDNDKLAICLKEINDKVYLKSCESDKLSNNNEYGMFELNMFLYFYNERKLIFVFDGFEDICPRYSKTVVSLLKVIKNNGGHKMWVASRPYEEILLDLQAIGL